MQLKRNGAVITTLVSIMLGCLSTQATAQVMGFDFGSSFFKITLVQPGKPFAVVENFNSKRKTESQMTIGKEMRLYAAESAQSATRNPQTTFADVASYFGVPHSAEQVEQLKLEQFVLNELVEDERGMIGFQTFSIDKKAGESDSTTIFTEELVSMILAYGKSLTEEQAGKSLKHAVITIPCYWTEEQRLMLMDAASMASISVMQLVHENSAAAALYGLDRIDSEKDHTVLFYNMGGRDTEVSVVRYSTLTEKDGELSEYVDVLGEGYDTALGGKNFDHALVKIFARKFNGLKQREGKADVMENTRAVQRLYQEAVKVKELLSFSKTAVVNLAELLDYTDLAFEVTRAEFEEECEALFERVAAPITTALQNARLSLADIDQVELLGGGILIPKVQAAITKAVEDKELYTHLNGDEAMSYGAAYIAANITDQYNVKKIYLVQHPKHHIRLLIEQLEAPAKPVEFVPDEPDQDLVDLFDQAYEAGNMTGTSYDVAKAEAQKLEQLDLNDIDEDDETYEHSNERDDFVSGGAVPDDWSDVMDREQFDLDSLPDSEESDEPLLQGDHFYRNEEGQEPMLYTQSVDLFSTSDAIGFSRFVSVQYDKNMRITAVRVLDNGNEEPFASFKIEGINRIVNNQDMFTDGDASRPTVFMQFSLNRSGLIQLLNVGLEADEYETKAIHRKKTQEEKDEEERKWQEDVAQAEQWKLDYPDLMEEYSSEEDEEMIRKLNEAHANAAAEHGMQIEVESEDEDEEPLFEDDDVYETDIMQQAFDSRQQKAFDFRDMIMDFEEEITTRAWKIEEIYDERIGAHLLSVQQKLAARKRHTALETRDKNKEKADVAKNVFESLIYELRDWLNEEENHIYVTDEEKETLLVQLSEGEDWLYEDGSSLEHTAYEERGAGFSQRQAELIDLKEEHDFRLNQLGPLVDSYADSLEKAKKIREYLPWVTVEEQENFLELIIQTKDWIDEKVAEQEGKLPREYPALHSSDLDVKMQQLTKAAKKIYGKKKPRNSSGNAAAEQQKQSQDTATPDAEKVDSSEASHAEVNEEL